MQCPIHSGLVGTTLVWRSGPGGKNRKLGSMRIGFGYDSHRLDETRPIVLGGVQIPDHPGLLGHSDGDAIAHAVTDALLGAAGLGDIGRHFPPSEARWKDADSMDLLADAVLLSIRRISTSISNQIQPCTARDTTGSSRAPVSL